jgi:hypothetical protein
LRANGDIRAVGDRDAARRLDLRDNLKSRLGSRAGATEIVDEDLGAARGQSQGVATPETAAGASDDCNAPIETDCHRLAFSAAR